MARVCRKRIASAGQGTRPRWLGSIETGRPALLINHGLSPLASNSLTHGDAKRATKLPALSALTKRA